MSYSSFINTSEKSYGCSNTDDNEVNQRNQPMRPMGPPPQIPTGPPTGPSPTPLMPRMPMAPPGEQAPQTVESTMYTPGYLKTQIGKMVRVEFLMSSGPLIDRIGTLLEVGASYIILRPIGTNDTLLCDIYSIKFVTVYSQPIDLRRPV